MNSPYDLVGPMLPQALRLARYQASASLPENINDLQNENDTINQTPSREEERLLLSNANVMTTLENLFSWRQKDRTYRTSKLSRMESVRFQRAMYRIWLMSVFFGRRSASTLGLADEDFYPESILEESWKVQKTFLQQFSSQELFQIHKSALFLQSTAEWAVTAEGNGLGGTRDTYDWDGVYLFAGPRAVLRCYEDETSTHLMTVGLDDDGPYTKFIVHALSEIVQERQVSEPGGCVGVILDDIHGEHDRCRHCESAGIKSLFQDEVRMLSDFYNETNWDDLKGQLDRQFLVARHLSYNHVEKSLMRALRGDWSRLILEMFACKGDEYAQWCKEDWICAECWTFFFRDTLWRWRLAKKRRAEEPIGADCK
ncbi:hypothetical protein OG21DRAFT_1484310 [Imleria badia]|nr:hypothetical protein OG21DRAFT_1484310 [Imleria badia]